MQTDGASGAGRQKGGGPRGGTLTPLGRTLAVLEVVAASPLALSPEQIAQRAQIGLKGLSLQLRILLREGLIEVSADGRGYLPGAAAQRLEALLSQNHPLMARVHPVLRALVSMTGESGTYNALSHDRRNAMAIVVEYGSAALQYELPMGVAKPLIAGASCKGILAWMGEAAIEQIMDEQLPVTQRNDTLFRRRLKRDLAAIRAQGYALSHGERLPGAVGMAAPVFAAPDLVCGSLVITIPEARFRSVKVRSLSQALMSQAAALSARLGGERPLQKGERA